MGRRMLAVLLLGGARSVASELGLGIHDEPSREILSAASQDSPHEFARGIRSLQETTGNDWMQSVLRSAGADPAFLSGGGHENQVRAPMDPSSEAAAAAAAEPSPKVAPTAVWSFPDEASGPSDESSLGTVEDSRAGDGGVVEASGAGGSGGGSPDMGPMLAAAMDIASSKVKAVSDDGVQILEGMLETFVHRGALTRAQRNCVKSGADDMAHVAYNASRGIANVVMALITPFEKQHSSSAAQASGEAQLNAAFSLAAGTLELARITPNLQQRIQDLIHHLLGYLKQCHAEGVEEALKVAAKHLADARFVAGGFVTNGADILQELEQGSMYFQQDRFHDFGRKLGKAFRKVLLSGNSTMLPEGPPSPEEMAKVTMGILDAFVGPGYVVELSGESHPDESLEAALDEDPANSRSHKFKYRMDLLKCIEEDRKLFESMLVDVYVLFSQLELGVKPSAGPGGEMPLPAMIMSVMGQLPGALQKCGVGKDPGDILADAMQAAAVHNLNISFPAPSRNKTLLSDAGTSPAVLADVLQTATDDWLREHYFRLGKDLGGLMREWLLIAFSGLYVVDAKSGRLFRHHGSASLWMGLRPAIVVMLIPGLLGLALFASRARRGVAQYTGVAESAPWESNLEPCVQENTDVGA
eukprot:TRINITY_DN32034_c0_g1_i1.p1 TRINITY_DN32034_c0_g1~~TRINITY_DN32034_c0_g1_i1.p1  ORF type:complete len:670 (-),score=128.32 TRINITY_DN32034_c0_g1_i1:31-1956(-)